MKKIIYATKAIVFPASISSGVILSCLVSAIIIAPSV
jgi:hypothetical protein